MALSFSTGLRQFVAGYGDYMQAFTGGTLVIYGGTVPTNADAAPSATVLCTVSLASGAVTKEVLSAGSVTVTGTSGTITGITVNGVEILGATITYTTSLTATALLVANQINKFRPTNGYRFLATASSAKVTITALPGTGTTPNGWAVVGTCSGGDLGTTDVNMGTEVVGVASANGLTLDYPSAGVLTKSGTWSGVNTATGTATHFRLLGTVNDTGGSSTTFHRLQGTCGVGSGDYPMSSLSLTSGSTHTVDTFTFTVPAA